MSPQVSHTKFINSRACAFIVAAVTVLSAFSVTAGRVSANDLIVYYDQSQLLRLPRPVAEVIIGNPSIADVSIQSGNLLVVTGKTFGMTNIIALDAERNIIQDQRILVERDQNSTVNVHKGGVRQSYNCTPDCSPTLTVGDDSVYFESISKQANNKTRFSSGSATTNSGAAGQ